MKMTGVDTFMGTYFDSPVSHANDLRLEGGKVAGEQDAMSPTSLWRKTLPKEIANHMVHGRRDTFSVAKSRIQLSARNLPYMGIHWDGFHPVQ
ncbi:hypothetical protein PsorP6_001110 [Peronosclerospora sorghi]|uniref:Uncharacterized protein n=1 Tax=Peronosclerospora sorghi TaxID=230839 RepID=A0ACC0WV15_9STRA|nr:hypothetical protein PsorP6_001110 [Peronosclerospora sorghi]